MPNDRPVTQEEPDPLDRVVGLDLAPADPLPAPMRAALPELLDADGAGQRSAEAPHDPGAPAADDEDGALAAPPAAPFVTETMANLLAAQGHTAQALEVYAQLLAQRPGDERLLARVAALRGEAPPASLDVPNAAASGGGDADERAARVWRAALAPVPADARADAPAPAAVATDPALDADLDDLSFERFFADAPEPVTPEPVGDFERWAAEVDRAPAGAAAAPASLGAPAAAAEAFGPTPAPAPALRPAPATPPDDPDADLAAFNAWLRGLGE